MSQLAAELSMNKDSVGKGLRQLVDLGYMIGTSSRGQGWTYTLLEPVSSRSAVDAFADREQTMSAQRELIQSLAGKLGYRWFGGPRKTSRQVPTVDAVPLAAPLELALAGGFALVGNSALKLYITLHRHGFQATATTETLARDAGLSKRTVRSSMKELQALAWIRYRADQDGLSWTLLPAPRELEPAALAFYQDRIARCEARFARAEQRIERLVPMRGIFREISRAAKNRLAKWASLKHWSLISPQAVAAYADWPGGRSARAEITALGWVETRAGEPVLREPPKDCPAAALQYYLRQINGGRIEGGKSPNPERLQVRSALAAIVARAGGGWHLASDAAKKLYITLFAIDGPVTNRDLAARSGLRRIANLIRELEVLGWITARQEADGVWHIEVLEPPVKVPQTAVDFYEAQIKQSRKRLAEKKKRLEVLWRESCRTSCVSC